MQDEYKEIYEVKYDDSTTLKYGVVNGSNKVLLIVGGQDCSIYGYENKYLKMAYKYNEEYGVTVVVASNPYNGENFLTSHMYVIHQLLDGDITVVCMGVSNGARLLAQYSFLYGEIERLLLVNGPLNINWHKTKKGLDQYKGKRIDFVYGEKDPSIPYLELINTIVSETDINVKTVMGADHNFAGLLEEFLNLPMELMV
jgi:hypothetical protein